MGFCESGSSSPFVLDGFMVLYGGFLALVAALIVFELWFWKRGD